MHSNRFASHRSSEPVALSGLSHQRPKLERDMLTLTRNFRDTTSQFHYKNLEEKVIAYPYGEQGMRQTKSHIQSMETTDEMFNLKDGSWDAVPTFHIPKSSLPEISKFESKPRKQRLRDDDLDWISKNWHKKNASKLVSKAVVSRDVIEMINLKAEVPEPSLSESSRAGEKSAQIKPFVGHAKSTIDVKAPNLKISFHSQSDAGLKDGVLIYDQLNTPESRKSATKRPSHRNQGYLVPIAVSRNYRQPSGRRPNEGIHPYSYKLPSKLGISGLTASDFYLSQKEASHTRITSGKSHRSQISMRPSQELHPVEPWFELLEVFSYHPDKSKAWSGYSGADGQGFDEPTILKLPEPSDNPEGNEPKSSPKNSDQGRRRSKRYQPKVNPAKVGYALPSNFMLKNMQDEFTQRKVVSAHPYKSYWLKCITECLDRPDVLTEEAGYFRVQPFREDIAPKTAQFLEETLDDLVGYQPEDALELETIIATREVMAELWQKLALDTAHDEGGFRQFDIKRFGKINYELSAEMRDQDYAAEEAALNTNAKISSN